MINKQIRLAGIDYESLVNGPGMRTVLFSQGCSLNCSGCFNQETHSKSGGKLMDMDDIVDDILSNPIIMGVTFSGGEPTEQAFKFSCLAKELKKYNINIWCYSGYTFEELLKRVKFEESLKVLLENIDVLVDGRFEIDKKDEDILYRGSRNQRIIDVPKSLKANKAIILNLE